MIIHDAEYEDLAVPGGGTMRMHLFRPVADGEYPALLLFSEIYQVTGPIRRLASMIAGHGFLVGVPEVYHEFEPPGTVLDYDKDGTERGNYLKVTKQVARFDADAGAALEYLFGHPACNRKLAAMGLCLGGHLALRAALNTLVSVAICCYPTDIHSRTLGAGRSDDTLDRINELQAEALFVWGRQDPHIPSEGRQAIRSRLEECGAHYDWLEVNAAHAFMRDEGPRYDPQLTRRVLDLTLDKLARLC